MWLFTATSSMICYISSIVIYNHAATIVPMIQHTCSQRYKIKERGVIPWHPTRRESIQRIIFFSRILFHIKATTRSLIRDTIINTILKSLSITLPREIPRGGIIEPHIQVYRGKDIKDNHGCTDHELSTSIGLPYLWEIFQYVQQMCMSFDRSHKWMWIPVFGIS